MTHAILSHKRLPLGVLAAVTLVAASAPTTLETFSPAFLRRCAEVLPPNVSCSTSYAAVACGSDDGVAHLDLLDAVTNVLTNVVVPRADADFVADHSGGVCLAPDVDLSPLTAVGFWAAWTVAPSRSAAGVGLHATVALSAGECLGRTVRVYSPDYFNDWPVIAMINHGEPPAASVDFVPVADAHAGMVHLFAVVTRDLAAGQELLTDYRSDTTPRPNFVDMRPSPIFDALLGGGAAAVSAVPGDTAGGAAGAREEL